MLSSPWIPFLLFFLSSSITAMQYRIPRLSPIGGKFLHDHSKALDSPAPSDDFKTFYYNQALDHFNYRPESYTIFPQRYIINFKYWGGPNSSAPILAYLGAESPIDGDLNGIGFMTDNAPQFNALLIYIEHRYYGKSKPFGSEALGNADTLGYFNSAQALADYATILIHVKKELNAKYSPVIVIGASYGGMLAAWFRLKYPHVALGALASSAPILYFDDITPPNGFYDVVTKNFREVSETCFETIKNSWFEIERVASQPNGLSILNQEFKTCSPLRSSSQLENYLRTMYVQAAQYNSPPTYPAVTKICDAIDGASSESGILGKIAAGVFALNENLHCHITEPTSIAPQTTTETSVGWGWQTCSEMVIPMGQGNDTMFPPEPFDLERFINGCNQRYGVPPRPHWVTTYYGGHDIGLVLKGFGSNIIFSNGLKDPYSVGGVLFDISDTLLAVYTTNGSHSLDIRMANENDPEWLVTQRKTEVSIIKKWINTYYDDLAKYKQ